MKIQAKTKYVFKGKEYNSLKEIQEVIHDIIGLEVIDKINRVAPPQKHKQLFDLLEVLCKPEVRVVLMECYNITFTEEIQEEGGYTDEITTNILDI